MHFDDVPAWQRAVSFAGLFAMVFFAWLLSSDRRRFPWRMTLYGIALQLGFGLFVLKMPLGVTVFSLLNDAMNRLLAFTDEGSRFVFGAYLDKEFSFAFRVLPTIIFFSSLMAVLYHLGFMQRVVKAISWVMQRTLKTSGAETLSGVANIFLGQTEAPLMVKPFVGAMTISELMTVMIGGFATVAGGVMAAYVGVLSPVFPEIAGHLIAASVLATPAGFVIAKVMEPEKDIPKTAGTLALEIPKVDANVVDATARGASESLFLALNVGAMLIAFMALVALVNYLVALPSELHNAQVWKDLLAQTGSSGLSEDCQSPQGMMVASCAEAWTRAHHLPAADYGMWPALSLQKIFGWIFWPIAFLMGVDPGECASVAVLLGEKTVLNEFVAYLHLGDALREGTPVLSHRSTVIATYALCGFSNFSSIAIQIGGIGGMAPERRKDLARLGLRAMIGGSLACFMTACVAGLLV